MTTRRSILVGALGVTLGALPVRSLDAQALFDWSGARQSIESFYTRIAFDAGGQRRTADGIGGRLMWQPWLVSGIPSSLAGRTSLGIWATYTPEDDDGGGEWRDLKSAGHGRGSGVRPGITPGRCSRCTRHQAPGTTDDARCTMPPPPWHTRSVNSTRHAGTRVAAPHDASRGLVGDGAAAAMRTTSHCHGGSP